MGIITIARELGAGETTIAPALAARLGWRVADRDILDRESELTGISLPHAARWDEHDPSFVERLQRHGPEFSEFLRSTRQIMQELAASGDVVIIGRGGNLLLRGHPETLHVKLIADMPFRVRRVMEIRWCDEHVAHSAIRESDRNKAAYFRHVLHVDWTDPMFYDIVLRTDVLGIDRIVDMLASRFERPAPAVSGESDAPTGKDVGKESR